jgi:hypothetical protein
MGMFEDRSNLDVTSVLMLLGEATIWKVVWSRFRSCRTHWKQWLFPISPGWTPLAGSLFAAINRSAGPPNLIFDRPPEGAITDGLILTNLDSGASHNASNIILQNIWQVWSKGPREKRRLQSAGEKYSVTREVGVLDVDISALRLQDNWAFWLQCFCLMAQLSVSFVLGFFNWSFEVFVAFIVAVIGQGLLLASITPRHEAWNHRLYDIHYPSNMALHRGYDSMEVLIIREAKLDGKAISLEEFCWDSQALRDKTDLLKLVASGLSFIILAFQIVLIGWMTTRSRGLYFALGGLGLATNAIEAASQPRWLANFREAFSGVATCAPSKSTLMGAVGILLAGEYPAAHTVAKLLYPDNDRFQGTRDDINQVLKQCLCANCRALFKKRAMDDLPCLRRRGGECTDSCSEALLSKISEVEGRQLKDALAAVCRYIQSTRKEGRPLSSWRQSESRINHIV